VRAEASRELDTKYAARPFAGANEDTGASGFHHHDATRLVSAMPWGSNNHTVPFPARSPRVASTASALFEVNARAPGASAIAGTAAAVVFPVRGPATSTEQSSQPWRIVTDPGTVFPIGNP